jgi:hypothetical protein
MDGLGARFSGDLKRSSTERDKAIDDLRNSVDGFNQSVFKQQQANFELVAGILKEIGFKGEH